VQITPVLTTIYSGYLFLFSCRRTTYAGNIKSLLLINSACVFIDIEKRIKILTGYCPSHLSLMKVYLQFETFVRFSCNMSLLDRWQIQRALKFGTILISERNASGSFKISNLAMWFVTQSSSRDEPKKRLCRHS